MLQALEFALGLLIALGALADIYAAVVVPRRMTPVLRVGPILGAALFPPWRWAARRFDDGTRRQDFLGLFGPLLLLACFMVWIGLLTLGFGLMAHALRDHFDPPLAGLGDAVYQAGLMLTTLGVNGPEADGLARWLVVWAGFAGFSVVTLIISFILSLQSGLQQRETLVLMMGERTGRPPSGVTLLETEAELGLGGELDQLFMRWEAWAASVLHSHAAFPILAYFRSADHDNDWLSAFGAVLDAATLVLVLVDDGPRGQALLLHRAGARTSGELCRLFSLTGPPAHAATRQDIAEARERLQAAGYAVREVEPALEAFRALSKDYAPRVHAMAAYFAVTAPDWLRSPVDDPTD